MIHGSKILIGVGIGVVNILLVIGAFLGFDKNANIEIAVPELELIEEDTGLYLSWTENETCDGVDIYYSKNANETFNCIVEDVTGQRYHLTEVENESLGYYKVCYYKMHGKKKMRGELSNICLNQKIVDLVIFMGQSNMAGRGENVALAPRLEKNTAFEFKAISHPVQLYHLEEPFGKYENKTNGINDVSLKEGYPVKSGGMVASLCKNYFAQTGIPIVGVSASKSGAGIGSFKPGKPLLTDAIERLEKAKTWLLDNHYNVRHIYMVWAQGEANSDTTKESYTEKTIRMIEEMRKHGVELCFMIATGDHLEYPGIFDTVREAQIELCENYEYAYMTTTVAETLVEKGMMSYASHYSQAGYNLVGEEAGIAMGKYVKQLSEFSN